MLASADTGLNDNDSAPKKDSETVTQLGLGLALITAVFTEAVPIG